MTTLDPERIAQTLLAAYESREPVGPMTAEFPEMTLDDAYAVQKHQVRCWQSIGRSIRGHKIGLTSAAMQRQLGVREPDFGHLTDTMFHLESQPIAVEQYISPRVEPEIAFVLHSSLAGPGVTVADAISAVDYVLPALEIIDSRVRDWRITLRDTVADNASSGGVVLGSRPLTLRGLTRMGLSLRTIGCVVHQSGDIVATGAGGAVLGSPLNALVWLANTLGSRGVTLEAGSVIMSGSLTVATPVRGGDSVTATFAGLGSVTATVVRGAPVDTGHA